MLERLRRDRRRNGADVIFAPQTFPNPARPNNVIAPFWTDLNPTGRRCGHDPDRRRSPDGVTRLAHRRLGRGEELQQRHHAHRRDLAPARGGPARAGERADHDLVRHRLSAAGRRSGLRPSTGAPRTATARAGRTSRPLRRTAGVRRSTRARRRPGGTPTITYDASSKKAGTYKSRRQHDLGRHAGHDAGGEDAHGHAVASRVSADDRGAASGRPLAVSCRVG